LIDFFDPDALSPALKELGYVDVVVDFTALHGFHVLDIVKELVSKVGHYIFISCSNVYYFDKTQTEHKLQDKKIDSPDEEKTVDLQVKYGNDLLLAQGKLSAENYLLDVHDKHNFPVTILRLPDVVGPYDNKGKHLGIQIALQQKQSVGTKTKQNMFSLVYAKDVIRAINETIKEKEKTFGKILNIAGDETLTIEEYIEEVAKILNVRPTRDNKKTAYLPSIYTGALDNSQAKRILQKWSPTPMTTWLPEVVEWYNDVDNQKYTAEILQRSLRQAKDLQEEKGGPQIM